MPPAEIDVATSASLLSPYGLPMTDLAVLRSRAAAHQDEIDLSIRYLTPSQLAARWQVSVSTVRDIPRDDLPYTEIGRGRLHRRRRYHPGRVAEYEVRRGRGAV